MKSLGVVRLASVYGHFLQATPSDGIVHADIDTQCEEDAFFLVEVDEAKSEYALINYANRCLLRRHEGGRSNHRITCDADDLNTAQVWRLIPGENYGLPNRVCLRAYDGSVMLTYDPGQSIDIENVFAEVMEPRTDAQWGGWWSWSKPTERPSPSGRHHSTVSGIELCVEPVAVGEVISQLVRASNPSTTASSAPNPQSPCALSN